MNGIKKFLKAAFRGPAEPPAPQSVIPPAPAEPPAAGFGKAEIDRLLQLTQGTLAHLNNQQVRTRIATARNPFNRFGAKVFSQSDEDGLIQEIIRRLDLKTGSYCEYGVGDGLECNTLALAAQGWRGFWISGEDLGFSTEGIDPRFFHLDKQWVTHDNVTTLFASNCAQCGIEDVDLLSFDLDGMDLFFVSALLEHGTRPKLFVVEANPRFTPPIRWSVSKEENFRWGYTDYVGASLQSFVDLFERYDYRLVCCNGVTGANAFFVRGADFDKFPEVPEDIRDIHTGGYFAFQGGRGDPRTVERALEIGQRIAAGVKNPEFP